MPFLTKNSKRKFDEIRSPIPSNKLTNEIITSSDSKTSPESNLLKNVELDKIKELEKKIKEKEDLVRRLKLVQHYKSRKDIQELDELVKKWTSISQRALTDLHKHYIEITPNDQGITMADFITKMKIDHKMVNYDEATESFQNL